MGTEDFLEKKRPLIEAMLEKVVPRRVTHDYLEWLAGKPSYAYDLEAVQRGVSDAVWDFLDRGGKRWRPALFLLMAEAFGKAEKMKEFAAVIELVHNGTIMVDDVEDDAETRRGKPALHKTHGTDIAVNTGNMLYFLPLLLFRGRKDLDERTLVRVYEAYIDEMVKLSLGQDMDIWWHKGSSFPNEKQYLQMCAFKTGTLARFSGRLAVILCGGTPEQESKVGRMLETVGIAFQIQDDILDLTAADRSAFGKSFGNDITEGKRTLAVIHALSQLPAKDKARLASILGAHTKDAKALEEAIELIKKSDSIAYAKSFARKLASEAWDECKDAVPESDAKGVLSSFVRYLVERSL